MKIINIARNMSSKKGRIKILSSLFLCFVAMMMAVSVSSVFGQSFDKECSEFKETADGKYYCVDDKQVYSCDGTPTEIDSNEECKNSVSSGDLKMDNVFNDGKWKKETPFLSDVIVYDSNIIEGGWLHVDKDNTIYTRNSKRNDNKLLISGGSNMIEEGKFISFEDRHLAKSLKGDYEVSVLEYDGENNINVEEFNLTSIELILESPYEDVPVKVDGIEITTINYSETIVLSYDNIFAHNYSLGFESTTITMTSTNNYTFEDNYLFDHDSDYVQEYNYGGSTDLNCAAVTSDLNTKRCIFKVAIENFVPDHSSINNFTWIYYMSDEWGDGVTANMAFNRLYGIDWMENNLTGSNGNSSWNRANESAGTENWMIDGSDNMDEKYVDGQLFAVSSYTATKLNTHSVEFDSTLVQSWMEGSGDNDGWYVNNTVDASYNWGKISSSEDGTNPWSVYIEYTITTHSPTIEEDNVMIGPSTLANVHSDLSCTFTPVDEDVGDTLTAYVNWYKNGVNQFEENKSVTNATQESFVLHKDNTTTGETWYCSVKIYDGQWYSDWNNSDETLITPTLQDQELITPYNVHWDNDVDCNFTALGNESTLTAYVKWYQDGIYQSARDDNKAVTNASLSMFTLSSDYTLEGNTWICEVRVNNGVDYSSWINSSDIEITNDRVWYGNETVTQDSIVQGMTYLEATFSDLIDSVLHWILKTELKETDLVGGILAKKVSGTPMLFLGVGNQTIGDFAVLGAEGNNTYMQLTPSDKTEIACNAGHVGAIIYSASDSKHYGCDGSTWNALY